MDPLDNLGKFKYPAKAGQTPFTDTTDRCERKGYQPSKQRIAALIMAGLQTQVAQDRLFDIIKDADDEILADLPAVPPLRRHLDMDLADIQEVSRQYSQKRRLIEQRVRAKRVDALRVAREAKLQEPVAGAPPLVGSKGEALPPGTAE